MQHRNSTNSQMLVPIERFHISPLNVRAGEPFGESKEDQLLIANLRQGKIIGPFKVRPENGGYGVVVGRRRFLSKKEVGATHFVAGIDFVIEELSDEEAVEASLIENLDVLRKVMNPITRANALNKIVSHSAGLRVTSRRLGIPASTLSEWLQVLELSPKLQEAIAEGSLTWKDGIRVVRLKFGKALQDNLADILKTNGLEAFRKEIAMRVGNLRRGIPKGVYEVMRVTWDKRDNREMSYVEALVNAAERKGITIQEYIKTVLIEHVEAMN